MIFLFKTIYLIMITLILTPQSAGDIFTGTNKLRDLSLFEADMLKEQEQLLMIQKKKLSILHFLKRRAFHQKRITLDLHKHYNITNPLDWYHLVRQWYLLRQIFCEEAKQTISKQQLDSYPPNSDESINVCLDINQNCKSLVQKGDCNTRKAYMTQQCALSCQFCQPDFRDLLLHMKKQIETFKVEALDMDGARTGIVRLQRSYKLSTSNLMTGNVQNYNSLNGLLKEDAIHIGHSAYKMNEWGLAVQWFMAGLGSVKNIHQLAMVLKKQLHSNINSTTVHYPSISNVTMDIIKSYMQMNDSFRSNAVITAVLEKFYSTPKDKRNSICTDINNYCINWRNLGHCHNKYKPYMEKNCKFSCGKCKFKFAENFPGELEIINFHEQLKRRFTKKEINMKTKNEKTTTRTAVSEITKKYEKLCRGQVNHPIQVKCRYRPALLLWNVYKEELLNLNPRVSMIYDVIQDCEAEALINLAKSKMKRAVVGDEKIASENRVSNVGWLHDTDAEIAKRLTHRVSLITGLETQLKQKVLVDGNEQVFKSSEGFQAVNYGIGGNYIPHTDFFHDANIRTNRKTRAEGDRIATFLLYLTKVIAGGSTVFPKLNLELKPTKNAAAFWYNSRLSGFYDNQTYHAGCPVLFGEKWVCNKWIREFGNHFKRRCGLHEDDKYHTGDENSFIK